MKWFINLKMRVKLITCFVILAVLTGIVGFIGISNMNTLNTRGEEMYNNNFIPATNIAKIQRAVLMIRSDYFLMVYERDTSKFQERYDEINTLIDESTAIISQYEKNIENDKTDRELLEKLKTNFNTYKGILAEHLEMVEAKKYDQSIAKIPEFTGARVKVEESINELVKYNEEKALSISTQNAEDFTSKSFIMIVIIAAAIILSIGLGLLIAGIISRPLNKLVASANQIADGNLDIYVDISSKDEIGDLAKAFLKMTDNLNDVMLNINMASEQVASAARQVSDTSIALSQGATEQASSIEELTASLEEIASQTKLNADNANEANVLASTTRANATEGNNQMKEMLTAMKEINESSNNISKIIKVIDDIAFQTNILALNAAVEAARAGQHGKGFAVVAEEVRNLAARSASAAKETTDLIEGSIKKVEDGTKIANQTANALTEIVEDVTKVADLVSSIAIASNEQAAGIAQINQGIMQVSEVVQTNSATSEESAAASEELASQAELLKDQIARFRLRKAKNTIMNYKDNDELNPEILKMLERMSEQKDTVSGSTQSPKRIVLSDKEFGKY